MYNILVDRCLSVPLMRALGVKIGVGCRFAGIPEIVSAPGGSISLGDRCVVTSRGPKNLLTTRCRFVLMKPGASIAVDDHVGLSGVTIFATRLVTIGKDSIIGSDSVIIDSDFHPIDPMLRIQDRNRGAREAPVTIGANVFVGTRAIILAGTTIGSGSVVGAGSVVSGSFRECSLIVGNPAKLVRRLDGRSTA